jgi:NhaP-type Na+/H+ or K+/H+ antiporter
MTGDLVYLVVGGGLLLAIVLPALLDRWAVSAPMVLVATGFLIGLTPLPDGLPLDPGHNRAFIEHATELVVIVALMGVGLALDRPLSLRDRRTWVSWGSTWRMLAIAMPLGIATVALLGMAVGLGAGAALLLGAVLAPTDPVLASDVQVAGPQTGDHEVDEPDELRFALTSEAGLNDALAFPFVYLAVVVAAGDTSFADLAHWLGWYVVGKVVLGIVVGVVVGHVLAMFAFRSRSASLRVAERGEALMSLAALVTAYGLTEVAHGYGFLGVFACAMTFRSAERSHDYHAAMHEVTERLERLLTLLVLLLLGIAVSRGLLADLDWRGVLVGLALIFVVRPVTGIVALTRSRSRMTRGEKLAVAFFGIRGIGSIYYVAYAAGEDPSLGSDWLWSTVAFTVVASVMIHGALASPALSRVGDARSDADQAAA